MIPNTQRFSTIIQNADTVSKIKNVAGLSGQKIPVVLGDTIIPVVVVNPSGSTTGVESNATVTLSGDNLVVNSTTAGKTQLGVLGLPQPIGTTMGTQTPIAASLSNSAAGSTIYTVSTGKTLYITGAIFGNRGVSQTDVGLDISAAAFSYATFIAGYGANPQRVDTFLTPIVATTGATVKIKSGGGNFDVLLTGYEVTN